jgi:hypothetical protein
MGDGEYASTRRWERATLICRPRPQRLRAQAQGGPAAWPWAATSPLAQSEDMRAAQHRTARVPARMLAWMRPISDWPIAMSWAR